MASLTCEATLLLLLRFYSDLVTNFTAQRYNIAVLKRKVQKTNLNGDMKNEEDY